MQGRFTGKDSAAQALAALRADVMATRPLEGMPQFTVTLKMLERALDEAAEIGVHYDRLVIQAQRAETARTAPHRLLSAIRKRATTAWRPLAGLAVLWLGVAFAAQWLRPEADALYAANAAIVLLLSGWVFKPLLLKARLLPSDPPAPDRGGRTGQGSR